MKRKIIWSVVILIIASAVFPRNSGTPVFFLVSRQKNIPILMYHRVSPDSIRSGLGIRVPPHDFEEQMKYLNEKGFHTISLDMLIDHWDKGTTLPPYSVIITFDDGYQDNYTYALPILKKYGFIATIFIVYNQVGRYNDWDAQKNIARSQKLLSWAQIRAMQKYGISFQSHTLNHFALSTLTSVQAKNEIAVSKRRLQAALGQPDLNKTITRFLSNIK